MKMLPFNLLMEMLVEWLQETNNLKKGKCLVALDQNRKNSSSNLSDRKLFFPDILQQLQSYPVSRVSGNSG